MAIDLGRVKSSASKYDAIVASQLKQAERRVRMLDLTAGLLGFAALSMAFTLGMVLCDGKLLLTQHTRQLLLYVYLAGAAVYLFFAVVRPLRMRVNPYYAARQVERQLPHAKNSIVNWVDLHEQPLPPAIRGALGQRAAKDLSRVDLESTISGRRSYWMGGLAGLFAIAFIVSYLLLGPKPFASLLKRTFNPFEEVGVSTRTRLELLKPEGGNTTVTVGHGVNFAVDVSGKVPNPKTADAVKLLYRYDEGDPWLERRLIQEASGIWTASLTAIEVKNGFWYKVTGGDAATEEYQVGVRAAPAITDFLATYHFRPYVALPDEIRRERELKALRGSEVLLCIRTNRTLREGRLEFEANEREGRVKPPVSSVRGEVDASESNALLVRFVLEEDGKYRLRFASTDGEAYYDQVSYSVTAIPDQPPTVQLTKPGKDIHLPVDALLHLEGRAGDDIGVKGLVLQMRVIGGDKLRGQPYRPEEQLRLDDGGYPRELEYKDFVELSRARSENGREIPLRAGMELEYWLEASDACDYPQPNVAESKRYRVLLTEPEKNEPKKEKEKNQAEKDKKQHDQKQDQKLQKENQERQQQRQEQQTRNKEQENKGKETQQSGAGEKSQTKEGGQGDNSQDKENAGKENAGQQGASEDGQGKSNSGDSKSELSKEDQNTEEKVKKALEKQQAGGNGSAQGKSEQNDQNDGKGEPSNNSDASDKNNAKSKGERQGSGQQGAKQNGEGKEKGQPQPGANSSSQDSKGDKSGSKGGEPKTQPGQTGEGKNKQQSEASKTSGESQSKKNDGPSKEKTKGEGPDSTKDDKTPADSKDGQSKGEGGRKDDGKTEKGQGGSAPKNEQSANGESKSSAGQKKGEESEKSEKQQDASSSARNATAKQVADLARSLESKDASERDKAKQQLQRIANDAVDPEAREKAAEALKNESNPDSASDPKTPKKVKESSGKRSGQNKEKDPNDGSKGTDSTNNQTDPSNKNPGQKNQQSGKNRQGGSSGTDPQGSPTSEDGTPGGGGDRRSGKGSPGASSEPKQPEKPRDHRTAQMQLEDFAKRVNKDILKEAGVSEAEWKKYLDAKRKQLTAPEKPRPETPNAPQQANQLPSMGGRTIQSTAPGQGDEQSTDHGQPLPGYRDSVREFRRQMSKNK